MDHPIFKIIILVFLFISIPVCYADNVYNLQGVIEIRGAISAEKNLKGRGIQYIFFTPKHIYHIQFIDKPPTWLKTGETILIKKSKINLNEPKNLYVSKEDCVLIRGMPISAIPDAFGPQKTIVLMVNFQDNPNNQPWTNAQVNDVIFNQVNHLFAEYSFQQTNIVGAVYGWFTLPINNNIDCDIMTNSITTLAENAARDAGIDLSAYRRRVYVYPNNPQCWWGGLGTIEGYPYSQAWLNGTIDTWIVGHELGHNLGLYHSNFLKCPGSSNQGNCTNVEYGDGADIMGGTGVVAHFNAFQKERLGWLNYLNSPPIYTITTSGSYILTPYELQNKNIKAFKILKNTLSDGSKDYYYLEFRSGILADAELSACNDCDFTKGILIHQGNNADPNTSHLLDMSPSDDNNRIVALLPGQTFTDETAANGGVSITLDLLTTTCAIIRVNWLNG